MGLDLQKLKDIVSQKDFNQLIGKIENIYFDCKAIPDDLSTDEGKIELAKDVAALANKNGGFLFIGVNAPKRDTHPGDEIVGLNPQRQNAMDIRRCKDIVNSWVYPRIEGLDISWEEMASQPGFGIFCTFIPPQQDSKRPFLIAKEITEKNDRARILFSFVERFSDFTQIRKIPELHG